MRIFQLNPQAIVMSTAALLLMASGIPAQASVDSRIEASAKNSYNFKTYLKDDAIKVSSSAGMVKLTGTVSDDFHKSLAEQTLSGLPGVKSVDNQLTVTGVQPAPRSDEWISLKVKSSLAFHKSVSATGTQVATSHGVVTLTGIAGSDGEKELAGEYAKDVEGVTEVLNEMSVAQGPKHAHESVGEAIDDTSITAQIKTTLLFHKSVRAMATKVITKEGNVSLHGEAKTQSEKDLVTKLAQDIKGVKHVSNHMTVAKL